MNPGLFLKSLAIIRCWPVLLIFLVASTDMLAKSRPYWNDIEIIRENVEAPRASFTGYSNRDDALARNISANEFYQSLNGMWKFHYSDTPAARPEDF